MPDVNITVDGKKLTAPAGTLLIEACKNVGIEVPSFCYYPGLVVAGRMPHVPGEDREDAQAADRVHHGDQRGHDGHHRQRRGAPGAQGHAGIRAAEPSAGLPGVRRRRRMRAPGHDLQLRRRRIQAHRHQEPPRRAAMVPGGLFRPPPLHHVLPLRARLWRRHGRLGAGHPEPRLGAGDRTQPPGARNRRLPVVRRVRHVHRHLSGRRAHQRRLPLQDPPLGDAPRGHHLHPLRRWLQNHPRPAPLPGRHGDRARRQSRQERHQRRLPLHQGPLRLRFCRRPAPPPPAHGPPRGQAPAGHLGRSDRADRRPLPPDQGRARRASLRRDRLQPHHQRRKLPAAEVRAHRARHQQR